MSDLEINIPEVKPLTGRTAPDPKDFFTQRIQIKQADTVRIPGSWDKVTKIPEARNQPVASPEELAHIVETPLLPSAIAAPQAGMVTCESNASFEPNETETTIVLSLCWNSLSPTQQARAQQLMHQDSRWQLVSAENHGDNFDALYFRWEIDRQTSPIQVHHNVFHGIEQIVGQPNQPTSNTKAGIKLK